MEKLLCLALLAFCINSEAQITLEHTYDSAATYDAYHCGYSQLMIINFEISGYRYVKYNRCNKCLNIYNMNHSLLKTISLSNLPTGPTGSMGDILYISEKLFNTDQRIEYMYSVYASQPYTGIYNEDGGLLFSDNGIE